MGGVAWEGGSGYLLVDLGADVGLVLQHVRPFVGVFGRGAFSLGNNASLSGGTNDVSPWYALGGEMGVDIPFGSRWNFSIDARGYESLETVQLGSTYIGAVGIELVACLAVSFLGPE